MAITGGFVDTATFMGAHGLFSAHITGNFILFAASLIRGIDSFDYLKLISFGPFILAVAMTAGLSKICALWHGFAAAMCGLIGALLLVSGLFFRGVFHIPIDLLGASSFLILLPVFAMGIQNAIQRILNPTDPVTTVMTGNVTQMVLSFTGYRRKDSPSEAADPGRALGILRVIAGFTLGCLLSAWMVSKWSLLCLIFPGLLMFGIAFLTLRLRE